MRGPWGLSNGPTSSYVKSFSEELYTRAYIWSQKEGVSGTKHFYSFHNFSECFYIREMPTKASNASLQTGQFRFIVVNRLKLNMEISHWKCAPFFREDVSKDVF